MSTGAFIGNIGEKTPFSKANDSPSRTHRRRVERTLATIFNGLKMLAPSIVLNLFLQLDTSILFLM